MNKRWISFKFFLRINRLFTAKIKMEVISSESVNFVFLMKIEIFQRLFRGFCEFPTQI